jgi:hypothetical protein
MFNFFFKNKTQRFSDFEIFRKKESVVINKIKYPPKLISFSITTPNKVLWTTSSSLTLWSRRNFCCQKASMMTNKVCNATVGEHGWMMALFVRDPKSSEMYTRCEVTYNVKVCGILFVGLLYQDFAILPSLCFMFVKFTLSKWGACQKLTSTQ